MIPTKEQAWDLLCAYNEGEFHRLHARIVGDVMRYFAAQLGYADEADFWQTVGILGSCEFAADYRKIGAFCRADVGIGPYRRCVLASLYENRFLICREGRPPGSLLFP